jgi:predicted aconitase
MHLSSEDRAALGGEAGKAAQIAMRILVEVGRAMGAEQMIDVASAHIDGCLYHGKAGLDFAELLVEAEARVRIPTTLNVSSLDLLHPHLYRGDPEVGAAARRLMDCYVEMGCRSTWTCAPYQLAERPSFGEDVAWAESNAIVFANSVLGARTDRYGDFIDICAAITGRAPYAGLHVPGNRRGEVVFRLEGIPEQVLEEDVFYPVLGHLVGRRAGTRGAVLDGLPPGVSEDRLKAVGAAAAASGAVAMFHVVGTTPEAPTLEAALHDGEPGEVVEVTPQVLRDARDELTTTARSDLGAVSVGTPHFSVTEFERLGSLVRGMRVADGIEFYVNTGRDVLTKIERRGWLEEIEAVGIQIVVDTCTYITPILRTTQGVVMTDSAKWAWYAPGNLGYEVIFGSLEECVRSASEGKVVRDPDLWG